MNIFDVITIELSSSFIATVQVTSSASEATCDQGGQRAKLNSQLHWKNTTDINYIQLPYLEWSQPWHTVLTWFLAYHLEVYMAYHLDILSNSIWHSFWHLFRHSFLDSVRHLVILTVVLTCFSGLLSDIYADMRHVWHFSLASFVRVQARSTASEARHMAKGSRHMSTVWPEGEQGVAPWFKSRDPHLAGGEPNRLNLAYILYMEKIGKTYQQSETKCICMYMYFLEPILTNLLSCLVYAPRSTMFYHNIWNSEQNLQTSCLRGTPSLSKLRLPTISQSPKYAISGQNTVCLLCI